MEQDTNLTYDSCKNCDRLEAEICRLEMIWETERGNNNRLKKENERLKMAFEKPDFITLEYVHELEENNKTLKDTIEQLKLFSQNNRQ